MDVELDKFHDGVSYTLFCVKFSFSVPNVRMLRIKKNRSPETKGEQEHIEFIPFICRFVTHCLSGAK